MDLLPSGSGWDEGTKIDLEASHADKFVLYGSYRHMDECGGYDGYTNHTITVTPSLASDFNLRISGRNRNDIKDYLFQTFDYALRQDIAYWLYAVVSRSSRCPTSGLTNARKNFLSRRLLTKTKQL